MLLNNPNKPTEEVKIGERTFTISPRDPYGFWYVWENEKLVEGMTFTSSQEAIKGLNDYVNLDK